MSGPKISFHRHTGRAYITVNRKRIYLGKWDGNDPKPAEIRTRYRAIVGQLYSTGRVEGVVEPKTLTVMELCARFLDDAEKILSRHELGKYERVTAKLCEAYGLVEVAKFTATMMRGMQAVFVGDGFCRSVINKTMRLVMRVFSWGVSYDLVPAAVLVGIKTVPGLRMGAPGTREARPVDLVSEADIRKTIPFLTKRIGAMLELQLLTGCRIGEIRTMRMGDIDRSGKIWAFRPAKHKNSWRGKTRFVPLGVAAQAILQPFLKADPDAYVFASWTGRPYQDASLARAVRHACDQAKIKHWAPRQIRKTVAQKTADSIGIEHAAALLGHSSIQITQTIYAKNQEDKATAAILKLDKIS